MIPWLPLAHTVQAVGGQPVESVDADSIDVPIWQSRICGRRTRDCCRSCTAELLVGRLGGNSTKVTELPQSEPREWVPTDAQLAAMFDAIGGGPDQEGAFRYMLMALNTWARPER